MKNAKKIVKAGKSTKAKASAKAPNVAKKIRMKTKGGTQN